MVGNCYHFDAPIGSVLAVGCVYAQNELGSGGHRQLNLCRVEAVDRDADAAVSQCGNGIAGLSPCRTWYAAQVDDICPLRLEEVCLSEQFLVFESRGVVNFGEDFDVILTVRRLRLAYVAKVTR